MATMVDMASRADPEESILTGLNGVPLAIMSERDCAP